MKKEPKIKRSREEKARKALYDALKGRLSEMRHCLKVHYVHPETDEIEEDIYHGINKGIHDVEHVLFNLLIDNIPVEKILKLNPNSLKSRIHPVRIGT